MVKLAAAAAVAAIKATTVQAKASRTIVEQAVVVEAAVVVEVK